MSRHSSQSAMYFRMLRRAATQRKSQASAALVAVIVAAAASTAMLNLYVDVQSKLRTEFRKFGANIVVEAPNSLPQSGDTALTGFADKAVAIVGDRGLTVPFAYAVARTDNDQPIVVAGTDFDKARQLNPWWKVFAWPQSGGQALVGERAAQVLNSADARFTLNFQGRKLQLAQAGTVETGAGEDSRVYISLNDFRAWTRADASVVEIAAYGSPEQVAALLGQLRTALPGADVHPVRQITDGEANILGKMRSTLLWSSTCIVVIAALCVLATLMGWVFDRRRDFAIMKALGASDWLIALFITGEAAILAVAGAVVGFGAGVGIAALIGRLNFHAPITPQFSLLPEVVCAALLVTLVSTLLPLRLLRGIQPAIILRGE